MAKARDLSLATKGILVVSMPLAALLVAMLVFSQFENQSREAERVVESAYEVRGETRRMLTSMVNAETGIRGYLLTGRPAFLQPYETSLAELPQIRANLRRLLQGDPAQL